MHWFGEKRKSETGQSRLPAGSNPRTDLMVCFAFVTRKRNASLQSPDVHPHDECEIRDRRECVEEGPAEPSAGIHGPYAMNGRLALSRKERPAFYDGRGK
jgi:hypothetical protein